MKTIGKKRTFKIDLRKDEYDSGINEALRYIQNYKQNFQDIKALFVLDILQIILNNANTKLNISQGGMSWGTSHIRNSWSIEKISNNQYILKNEDNEIIRTENHGNVTFHRVGLSILAEFGTGLVGSQSPHPVAQEQGYRYDVNNHGEKGWSFNNTTVGLKLTDFSGYAGHKFLYRAMLDFQNNVNPTIEQCLDIWNKHKNRLCK